MDKHAHHGHTQTQHTRWFVLLLEFYCWFLSSGRVTSSSSRSTWVRQGIREDERVACAGHGLRVVQA